MKIADFAIRHPAIIGILLIALALFGLLSFRGMNRDLLANIEMPEVLILTVYPGASPEVVERDVTEVLEDEFGLISGVRKQYSESRNGYSLVFLTLDWDSDLEAKKNDVRDRINNALSDLPDGLNPQLYELGTASFPVYSCTVESELGDAELAQILEDEIVPRFSRISEVSAVYGRGIESPALRVRLNHAKLEAANITAGEVYASVARGQATIPAGEVKYGADRLPLQSSGDYDSIADLRLQPVGYNEAGVPVYLDEISRIAIGTEDPEFRASSQGQRIAALDLMKRSGGDTEKLVDEARKLQAEIEGEYAGVIRFNPIMDNAATIDITLRSVAKSAWLGGLLAAVILFIFLHDIRAVLIVSLSVPFTVFLTFILMRARGMTLNMMTLAGITVSIGMIVDASIVILENTVRHRNLGLGAFAASSRGAGEVAGAILASTSTSLSVFVPILFLSGLTGAILTEVSWVLIFSLSSAAVTALIIVPWLSSRVLTTLTADRPPAGFGRRFEKSFSRIADAYSRFLILVLDRKRFVVILAVVLAVVSLATIGFLGGELFAAPDMNEFEVYIRLPAGYDLDDAQDKVSRIARIVRNEVPEIEADLWYAGLSDAATIIQSGNPSAAYGRIRLVRTRNRNRSVFEIVRHLNEYLRLNVTDAEITVRNGGLAKQMNYATDGAGFRIEITGPEWADVVETARDVAFLLENDPLIHHSDIGIRMDRQLMELEIDRISAGRLAVDPVNAGRNLRILFNGETAGTLKTEAASMPIILDSDLAGSKISSGVLGQIYVRNYAGMEVPYSAFSRLERLESVDQIPHTDRLPSLVVVGQMLETNLSAIRRRVEPALENADLPPGVNWRIVGAADLMGDTFRDLAVSLGIAIFLVYAVMVIQFERFGQPFIIMGAVPFVLIGVALSLAAFGSRITMMSFFGVIALGGMVVNNAIVLVEFTNQRRKAGLELRNAVIEAARIRLKPILITTLTTLLGLVPLAFALGEGSEVYAPLGQVIGGGLLSSTLITLVLIPVLYEWAESRWEGKGRRVRGGSKTLGPTSLGGVLIIVGFLGLPGSLNGDELSLLEPEAVIDLAIANDANLASLRAQVDSTEEDLLVARSYKGPTLRLEFGASFLSDPLLSVPAGALGSLPLAMGGGLIPSTDIDVWGQANDFRYDVNAVLEQPLFTWGRINAGIRAGEAGFEAAQWTKTAREQRLETSVRLAFESLSVLNRMLRISENQLDLGGRLAEMVEESVEEGFALQSDYQYVRDQLREIEFNRSSILQERYEVLLSLEEISGRDGLEVSDLELPTLEVQTPGELNFSAEDLILRARTFNPDFQAVRALVELEAAILDKIRGEAIFKPEFVFRTEFGYGGGFDRSPDDIDGTWTLSVGARTTLFDSGRSAASRRKAEAELAMSRARRLEAERQIERQIRSTLYSLELIRKDMVFHESTLNTETIRAREKLDAWNLGFGGEDDWLRAELDRTVTDLHRHRVFLDYRRSYLSLLTLLGRNSETATPSPKMAIHGE